MARLFVTSINLNKNELQNARIHNLGDAPSNAVVGQIYYNTGDNKMYYYNGLTGPDGPWMPMSGSTEVIQDVIGDSVIGGTGLTSTYVDSTGYTTIDLDDTAVTAGSYGSSTAVPTFTVDAQGRLTAAGTASISTDLGISADSGSDITISLLTEGLTVSGGEGIDTSVSGNTLTIAAELASSTNKGVASFNSTDFTVTSGDVTVNEERVQDIVNGLLVAGEGIDITYVDASNTLTVDAEIATSSNRGVASFASADFTVTDGAVAITNVNLATQTTGNYIATIAGTTLEVEVSGSGTEDSAVTIGLPDAVTITTSLDTPTVNAATIQNDGDIALTALDGNVNIDASSGSKISLLKNTEITGTLKVSSNMTVDGDLNVNGNINAVDRTEVNIQDNTIRLNTGFTGTPTVDAGIVVERGDETDTSIIWNETDNLWTLTNNGTDFHSIARKFKTNVGETDVTTYTVTHNLGTKDVTVQVFDNSSPYAQVETDVEHTTTSAITLKFAVSPSTDQYRVVIVG